MRKGALLLLVLMVTWTATPLLVCAATSSRAHVPPCCRAMAQPCGQATLMSGSCCTVEKTQLPVEPVTTLSLESSHNVAFVPAGAGPEVQTASAAQLRAADAAPAPDTSPGRTSILRI
jgi:hypothetical protein